MTLKRAFILLVLGLFLYLALYTWNERTGSLNLLAENTGLEVIGTLLSPANKLVVGVSNTWERYADLVNVREERDVLAERLVNATTIINSLQEDRNEMMRLRKLMNFSPPENWTPIGARIIGTRIGPQAVLNSMLLDKGFANGALPGTPVVTQHGVVGQVLRSSPHFSNVILINDPSCRIAVATQETRFPGIVSGQGPGKPLIVHYVPPNAQIKIGEYLVTSGRDGLFPKGIPVGWVESARPSDTSPFQTVTAWPLPPLNELEEVLLLQPSAGRKENPFNRFMDDLPLPPAANTQTPGLPVAAPPEPEPEIEVESLYPARFEPENQNISPAPQEE